MAQTDDFSELIRRVRRGDPAAAEELCRSYEPVLQREIRLRLRDPRLRRRFDENDVCQSVMASFFVRVTAGEFDLEGPEQLQRLLAQMGRNKLASQARRHGSARRDYRRVAELPSAAEIGADPKTSPSQALAWQELLQRFRAGLSDEERRLADLRTQGKAWTDIADQLGGTADSRRVQLNRAIARVARELGLEEAGDA